MDQKIELTQVDLHSHSNISDGQLPPREVMALAAENGAQMVALTDHDHLGGIDEASLAAKALGMQFVTGVEISTSWQGYDIHMVGLNFDHENGVFNKRLADLRSGRIERMQEISSRLEKKGILGVYEGALSLASNPEMVGRAHAARFLVQEGIVKNLPQAFKKYLGEGKAGYVVHQWVDFAEAVSWIRDAGGLSVIAHPGRYNMNFAKISALIETFKDAGGDALEVSSSSHKLNEILKFAMLAERYELLSSVGSDFHVLGEGGRMMGKPPQLPKICRPIWEKFKVE